MTDRNNTDGSSSGVLRSAGHRLRRFLVVRDEAQLAEFERWREDQIRAIEGARSKLLEALELLKAPPQGRG